MRRLLVMATGLTLGGLTGLLFIRWMNGLSPIDKAAIHAELSLPLEELNRYGRRPLRVSQLEP